MNDIKMLKIEIPEGYEVDRDNSTFEKIIFKPTKSELPKKWEDLKYIDGYWINSDSKVIHCIGFACCEVNKSIWPTKELAEAALALSQLLQLRDVYNDGWQWIFGLDRGYIIFNEYNKLALSSVGSYNAPLIFKSPEIRDLFAENFKDLIQIALPLL